MRISGSGFARAGGAAIFATLLLSSCTLVLPEGPDDPLPPRPAPDFCTREYAPVCGGAGGDVRTFGNACEARADGYRILYPGECRRAEAPQFCTQEYAPVCARRRGDVRTFSNQCTAEAEGYQLISDGPC